MSTIGEEGYKIFNIRTQKSSKKIWKTYRGAIKHCGEDEIVATHNGIDWITRHHNWCSERLTICASMEKSQHE